MDPSQTKFYKGEAPGGIGGDVWIEFDGQVYTGRFSLGSDRGNEGRTGSKQSDCWNRIDVPAILRLREG